MKTHIRPVIDLIESIKDFDELVSLKQVMPKSTTEMKLFKFKYLDPSGMSHVIRIELNLKKNKISYGSWKDSVLLTRKVGF